MRKSKISLSYYAPHEIIKGFFEIIVFPLSYTCKGDVFASCTENHFMLVKVHYVLQIDYVAFMGRNKAIGLIDFVKPLLGFDICFEAVGFSYDN